MITPYTELKTLTTFPKTDAFLSELLINKDAALDTVLKNPSKYKVQVIYTRVTGIANNAASLPLGLSLLYS